MSAHPTRDELAGAAAGDVRLREQLAPHLATCSPCRAALARSLGILEAAAEEMIRSRPGCPAPDVLAAIPDGREADDPHLQVCPLCREELAIVRELETTRRLRTAVASGVFRQEGLTVEDRLAVAAAVPGGRIELDLRPGATTRGRIAGCEVTLEVTEEGLAIEVTGTAEAPLELLLENDLLERVLPLEEGRRVVEIARWTRATVRRAGGAGR